MESIKRSVSLASAGVIGYYVFNKLNEAKKHPEECPEDNIEIPALKEATLRDDGVLSVDSVKRMSEIIAEQARLYAAAIRYGIRTPILVENTENTEDKENTDASDFATLDDDDDMSLDMPDDFDDSDTANEESEDVEEENDEIAEDSTDEICDTEQPVDNVDITDDNVDNSEENDTNEDSYSFNTGLPTFDMDETDSDETEGVAEDDNTPVFGLNEDVVEEPSVDEESNEEKPEEDDSPVFGGIGGSLLSFAEMGGFGEEDVPPMPNPTPTTLPANENDKPFGAVPTPVATPVAVPVSDGADFSATSLPTGMPVAAVQDDTKEPVDLGIKLPKIELTKEEKSEPELDVPETPQPTLMENIQPLQRINEEEEDEASKQEFASIAAYLDSL